MLATMPVSADAETCLGSRFFEVERLVPIALSRPLG